MKNPLRCDRLAWPPTKSILLSIPLACLLAENPLPARVTHDAAERLTLRQASLDAVTRHHCGSNVAETSSSVPAHAQRRRSPHTVVYIRKLQCSRAAEVVLVLMCLAVLTTLARK
jgi:hypothetical protein